MCALSNKYPPAEATLGLMSTDLSQVDVHPVVTGDKVAVVGLPILQLDQHRVVLRSAQQ